MVLYQVFLKLFDYHAHTSKTLPLKYFSIKQHFCHFFTLAAVDLSDTITNVVMKLLISHPGGDACKKSLILQLQ
jgi:hypothetical protein